MHMLFKDLKCDFLMTLNCDILFGHDPFWMYSHLSVSNLIV